MTHHTWRRHVIFWLLLLGVLWLPLPSLTADLNTACESHAAGKFQIRAMIYTANFAYLLDSDGQLFVEDVDTFLDGIEHYPTTITLSKPSFSLPTYWHPLGEVDYASGALQFGFTADHPEGKVTLRMITYNEQSKLVCVNRGFVMKGREAPSSCHPESVCVSSRGKAYRKPAFWLNDQWTMYPISLTQLDSGMQMNTDKFDTRYNVQIKFLKVTKWNDKMVANMGTISEFNLKPQSGLLTEKIIFIATQDSTGHCLSVKKDLLEGTVPWHETAFNWIDNPPLGISSVQWPLSEVVKLQFCQVEPPVEPKVEPPVDSKMDPKVDLPLPIKEDTMVLADLNRDSVKPTKAPPSRKIPYLVLAGVAVIVLALVVYAVLNWWKKTKKPTRKRKKGDKASKRGSFWSQIRGFLVKVFPCTGKRRVSKVRESRAISLASGLSSAMKQGKGGKKRDNKTGNFCGTIGGLLAKVSPCKAKKKMKGRPILVSTVRDSILLASMASMAAAASKANPSSVRRKKGPKVGPKRRASLAV